MEKDTLQYKGFYYGKLWKADDKKSVYLDHQCDEWLIGDIEQFEKFLENGRKMLEKIKEEQDA